MKLCCCLVVLLAIFLALRQGILVLLSAACPQLPLWVSIACRTKLCGILLSFWPFYGRLSISKTYSSVALCLQAPHSMWLAETSGVIQDSEMVSCLYFRFLAILGRFASLEAALQATTLIQLVPHSFKCFALLVLVLQPY